MLRVLDIIPKCQHQEDVVAAAAGAGAEEIGAKPSHPNPQMMTRTCPMHDPLYRVVAGVAATTTKAIKITSNTPKTETKQCMTRTHHVVVAEEDVAAAHPEDPGEEATTTFSKTDASKKNQLMQKV